MTDHSAGDEGRKNIDRGFDGHFTVDSTTCVGRQITYGFESFNVVANFHRQISHVDFLHYGSGSIVWWRALINRTRIGNCKQTGRTGSCRASGISASLVVETGADSNHAKIN